MLVLPTLCLNAKHWPLQTNCAHRYREMASSGDGPVFWWLAIMGGSVTVPPGAAAVLAELMELAGMGHSALSHTDSPASPRTARPDGHLAPAAGPCGGLDGGCL